MSLNENRDIIKVSVELNELSQEDFRKKASSLAAVIVNFFEQNSFKEDYELILKFYLTQIYTSYKSMLILSSASMMLKSKGFILESTRMDLSFGKSSDYDVFSMNLRVRDIFNDEEFMENVKNIHRNITRGSKYENVFIIRSFIPYEDWIKKEEEISEQNHGSLLGAIPFVNFNQQDGSKFVRGIMFPVFRDSIKDRKSKDKDFSFDGLYNIAFFNAVHSKAFLVSISDMKNKILKSYLVSTNHEVMSRKD